MIFTCWGVRGTLSTPGPHTIRYGGHTSCVSVEIDGKVLIIDAGSGMRPLGNALLGTSMEVFVLLTHLHYDHIAGFPFFAPLFENTRPLHLLDYRRSGYRWSLLQMIDGVHFPRSTHDLPLSCCCTEPDALDHLRAHGFDITALEMNHPGGAYGYRIEHDGRSVVYMPDNELYPPEAATTSFEVFATFCHGADVLCHDAQYLAEDMPDKHGWGHSLVGDVCTLAIAAHVKHLVLFHHDPDRTDTDIDALQAHARAMLEPHGIACTAAYEGLTFELSA